MGTVAVERAAVLVPLGSRKESGHSETFKREPARPGALHLNVSEARGELGVHIEWRDPASGQWLTMESFARVTGEGNQRIWTRLLPSRFRVRWAIEGGAAVEFPSFTFSVGLTAGGRRAA